MLYSSYIIAGALTGGTIFTTNFINAWILFRKFSCTNNALISPQKLAIGLLTSGCKAVTYSVMWPVFVYDCVAQPQIIYRHFIPNSRLLCRHFKIHNHVFPQEYDCKYLHYLGKSINHEMYYDLRDHFMQQTFPVKLKENIGLKPWYELYS
jgi:hypothetical protein